MNDLRDASHGSLESLPDSPHAAVDRLCEQFARQWQTGPPPRIEEYLAQLPDQAKPFGFRHLLALELECKVNAGKPLDAEGYRRRFPQYHELARLCLGTHCPRGSASRAWSEPP